MQVKITDLKLFADIQAKLDSVTPGMLEELKGSKTIPNNAIVIGELTPALKVLLCYRNMAAKAANAETAMTLLRAGDLDQKEVKEALANIKKAAENAEEANSLFWAALQSEFPETGGKSVGYGPKFEVYTYPANTAADQLSALFGDKTLFAFTTNGPNG